MIAQTPNTGTKPPAYIFPNPDDDSTAIVLSWQGVGAQYDIKIQRRGGFGAYLGAILHMNGSWYLFYIGKDALNPAESFPFESWHDAVLYLYEDWLQKRKAAIAASLAEV